MKWRIHWGIQLALSSSLQIYAQHPLLVSFYLLDTNKSHWEEGISKEDSLLSDYPVGSLLNLSREKSSLSHDRSSQVTQRKRLHPWSIFRGGWLEGGSTLPPHYNTLHSEYKVQKICLKLGSKWETTPGTLNGRLALYCLSLFRTLENADSNSHLPT